MAVGLGSLATAQDLTSLDKKQQVAFQKVSDLLEEQRIDTAPFQQGMSVAKFLALVEKQLPADKKVAIRLDRDAFGDKFAEVAATKITMPKSSRKITLRSVLDRARSQVKAKTDYRLDGAEIIITTPDRALFTLHHEIRDIVSRPEAIGLHDSAFRNASPAKRAELLVKQLMTALDGPAGELETIDLLNGTRLSIRAVGTRQLDIAQVLRAFARIGDLAVTTQCKLYEVDDAFHTKLKNAKRIPIEEQERNFLEGKQPKGESLIDLLAKHKLILAGDEALVHSGQSASLLSRRHMNQCLPGPKELARGDMTRQLFFTGIEFNGGIGVSPDRRFVRLKLTETATELQEIQKRKVFMNRLGAANDEGRMEVAEVPILKESATTQDLEIPDGGTILLPVHHRPRSLEEQKRWYALLISPRIIIEEEERHILLAMMGEAIPALVADVLTNPRLKATRDYCGTPGDKRFALVNSDAWTWPKEFQPKVKGAELTAPTAKGNRLLGIRIDSYDSANIRVTLVNAGGDDNGAAPGGCTLRYRARSEKNEWRAELIEP
jgi:hypothetical protein